MGEEKPEKNGHSKMFLIKKLITQTKKLIAVVEDIEESYEKRLKTVVDRRVRRREKQKVYYRNWKIKNENEKRSSKT